MIRPLAVRGHRLLFGIHQEGLAVVQYIVLVGSAAAVFASWYFIKKALDNLRSNGQ
jgi:hypothetical protein